MSFFDRFATTANGNLYASLSKVATTDSVNYSLMACVYASEDHARSEAQRISDTLKKENPDKYPNGIEFRVIPLSKVIDSEKIRKEIKLLSYENACRNHGITV